MSRNSSKHVSSFTNICSQSIFFFLVLFVSKSHFFLFDWISPDWDSFFLWRSHSVVMVPKDSLYKCWMEDKDLSYLHNVVFQTLSMSNKILKTVLLVLHFDSLQRCISSFSLSFCLCVKGQSTVPAAAVALTHISQMAFQSHCSMGVFLNNQT